MQAAEILLCPPPLVGSSPSRSLCSPGTFFSDGVRRRTRRYTVVIERPGHPQSVFPDLALPYFDRSEIVVWWVFLPCGHPLIQGLSSEPFRW